MTETHLEYQTCPHCGHPYPEGSYICPFCHTRVARSFWSHPPRWFVVLLIVIIVLLAAYAGYLAYQMLVTHNY